MHTLKCCLFVLVLAGSVYSQTCSDCMNYDRCPEALDLALYSRNAETIQLFKSASCGYDHSGTIPVAKICCSAFSLTSRKGGIDDTLTDSSEDVRIANHRNLNLLPTKCGTIQGDRIVGGAIADLYEFPWMALISHETRDGVRFKCGGSIINKRYILTAAHCVKDKIIAGVRVGEYDISNDHDCQKGVCETHIQDIPVVKSIIHERYRGLPKVVNDIALLRVAADIDFNHMNVDQICLPITSTLRRRALSEEMATVTGWGITENHTDSAILRKVVIPIHTAQQCSNLYNRYSKPGEPDATADQLCAGSENKDSCNGDSGGPLMVEEKYNNIFRYVQYGVVSHGPQKCGSNYPGVYTDVTKFVAWILNNIAP